MIPQGHSLHPKSRHHRNEPDRRDCSRLALIQSGNRIAPESPSLHQAPAKSRSGKSPVLSPVQTRAKRSRAPQKQQSHLFSTSISRIIIALPKIIDVFARASVNIMPGRNTFLAGQQALRAEGAYQWLSSFEASFSDSGIHRSLRLVGPSDRSGEDIPEAVPGQNPKSGIANPIR